MSMCACYISTPFIFPVVIAGTAFGICNLFGRFFGIGSGYGAELTIPRPMEIFCVLSLIGLVVSPFIKTANDLEA